MQIVQKKEEKVQDCVVKSYKRAPNETSDSFYSLIDPSAQQGSTQVAQLKRG